VRRYGAHSHKKKGDNRPKGSAPGCQNVFCFLLSRERGLSATIFETTDVNRFPHAYTGEKFPNFCAGNFPDAKNSPKYGTLGWGVCDRAASQTAQLWVIGIISGANRHPFCMWVLVGDIRFGRYKPPKKLKFCRIQYLSWPNRVTVGLNSNRNRLPLGTVLYSDNLQQLITTMSTHERLQRDHATPEMNCWDDMRQSNVTRKGAARSLWAYIAVCSQTHCNPSS